MYKNFGIQSIRDDCLSISMYLIVTKTYPFLYTEESLIVHSYRLIILFTLEADTAQPSVSAETVDQIHPSQQSYLSSQDSAYSE